METCNSNHPPGPMTLPLLSVVCCCCCCPVFELLLSLSLSDMLKAYLRIPTAYMMKPNNNTPPKICLPLHRRHPSMLCSVFCVCLGSLIEFYIQMNRKHSILLCNVFCICLGSLIEFYIQMNRKSH